MTSTEISPAQRYRDLAAGFTARIDAVPADRWDDDSPCEGWTARDVVRHVLDSERDMVKVVGLELAPGPSVDDDPSAAWAAVRNSMQEILDDPAKSTWNTTDTSAGPTSGPRSRGSCVSIWSSTVGTSRPQPAPIRRCETRTWSGCRRSPRAWASRSA